MTSKGWTRGPVLGRGSTATVSIASANASGELFAVKSSDLSKSSLLQRELQFLSSLDSDNVVSCLGHDVSDGLYNLFLEYAPGGTLSHYVAKHGGSLTEPDIRSRTREVLTGLAVLHSRNIVHCDVKSQNILIGSGGQAMVADLGCAKSTTDRMPLRGTPMFMAPEVARGERQGTDADIWAVGCVAIEMATGRAPWPGASEDAIAVLHRIGFSDDVPEVPRWLSEDGKDFLGRCLRREAEERWSAEELLRHPFLMNCADSDSDCKWTSPKSILDWSIWESLETDTADEEEASVDQPQRMIAELVGSGGPDWTWDENWLTVRTDRDRDDDEEGIVDFGVTDTGNTDDDDSFVGEEGLGIANLVTDFTSIDYALNNCDFVVNSEHYFISNGNKRLLITVLKSSDSIWHSPFVFFSLLCCLVCFMGWIS